MSEIEQSSKSAENAGRERYWEELSEGEKIERMRLEVKRLVKSLEHLTKSAHSMRAHKHLDGQMVVPLDFYTGESERSSRAEKYF